MRLSQKGIAPLIVSPQCSSCLNILTKNTSFAFLLVAVAMPDENDGDAMDDDEEIGREEWIRGERLSRSRARDLRNAHAHLQCDPGQRRFSSLFCCQEL